MMTDNVWRFIALKRLSSNSFLSEWHQTASVVAAHVSPELPPPPLPGFTESPGSEQMAVAWVATWPLGQDNLDKIFLQDLAPTQKCFRLPWHKAHKQASGLTL